MPETSSAAGAWRSVGRSAGARIAVLPLSALLGIVNTRLILDNFGQAAYAQYGLLIGIGTLLPFADLGISAAITNAVSHSDDPSRDPEVRRVLVTALRILTGSASVIVCVAVALTLSGAWPALMGRGLIEGSGPRVAGLCLAVIGVSLLVGFGQRILIGVGRNHVAILLLGLQTPIVLCVLLVLVHTTSGAGAYLAVIPYLVTLGLSAASTAIAVRQIRPAVAVAARGAPHVRTVHGGAVFSTAWPMLVQMIALPIAMQTDRLVLSHISPLEQLARYNLGSQVYSPVWQVVSSAGVALWPVFAKARRNTSGGPGPIGRRPSPLRMSAAFTAVAASVCLVLSFASPWLVRIASGGRIHLGVGLLVAFSLFMTVQAAKYPLGMYMTDPRGLRFQAYMIVMLLPVNLGLSIWLAGPFGAVGPVVGSFVGVLAFQVLANLWYVRRDLRTPTGGPVETG